MKSLIDAQSVENVLFLLSNSIDIRLLTRTEERPHVCMICAKGFWTPSTLKRHILTHTGEKNYTCDIINCGKCFGQSYQLKRHMLTHDKHRERPHICNLKDCGKSFTCLSQLKCHILTHTDRKRHKCQECGQSFAAKSSLNLMATCYHTQVKHLISAPSVVKVTASAPASSIIRRPI